MTERIFKGRSLFIFPENYTVIDIETTGMVPQECEILEISALRCRNDLPVASFSTLIKPEKRIPQFITRLTGISDGMVQNAPDAASALRAFYEFAGRDLLMGYNVHFDVNFLYDHLMKRLSLPLSNDFVDVLRFARKALPFLESRAQTSVAAHYGVCTTGAHRALRDCAICREVYLRLREEPVFSC